MTFRIDTLAGAVHETEASLTAAQVLSRLAFLPGDTRGLVADIVTTLQPAQTFVLEFEGGVTVEVTALPAKVEPANGEPAIR